MKIIAETEDGFLCEVEIEYLSGWYYDKKFECNIGTECEMYSQARDLMKNEKDIIAVKEELLKISKRLDRIKPIITFKEKENEKNWSWTG